MSLSRSHEKRQEPAIPFGFDVYLAGEASAAPTECLVFPAATSSTCSVLMSANRAAIDEVLGPVDLSVLVGVSL